MRTPPEQKVFERAASLPDVDLPSEAILAFDADRRPAFANAAALALLEASDLEDLARRPLAELFDLAADADLRAWFDALWSTPGQAPVRKAELVGARGRRVAVRIAAVSAHHADGASLHLVLHDETELRAMAQAREHQRRFVDQLIEAIPVPLSVRDEQGHYLHVNRAYETVFQCDREAVLGRSVLEVLPPALAREVLSRDEEAMRSSDSVAYETRIPHGTTASDMLFRARALRRSDGHCFGVVTVKSDVSEMRAKELALVAANAKLESLSQQLIRAQEAERRRVARDLHDQIGQILTALKLSLRLLAQRDAAQAEALQPSLDLAEEALRHTRNLTATLHPHMLEDLGLAAAIEWLLDHFVRTAVASVTVRAALVPERSSTERELTAFRVVQEALTNVVRHANAAAVQVDLEARDGRLVIHVADDGDGFAAGTTQFNLRQATSLGIASMRERVAEAGGRIAIESAPSAGTVVSAELPW